MNLPEFLGYFGIGYFMAGAWRRESKGQTIESVLYFALALFALLVVIAGDNK